ncbi:MAG: ubiquinone biosynthesis hydroxylase, UbiH/UbiF/VisC/COQ6 family [uncultured bacterium]|nr:MAG: ubiquinone biosynthesis hydroxylase, UbiH/UbiF/VisC/COQ6 family [uncultured bacterium]
MHIWDHAQLAHLDFDAADIGETQMGWIVENRAIVNALRKKLTGVINFYCPNQPVGYEKNILILKNHQKIPCEFVIGADGANSWVRQQMNIDCQERSYQQKAIIAVIQSELPHQHTAIQKFLTTGPAALLPLHDQHHTALVWSSDNIVSDEHMKKTDTQFEQALSAALDFKLGKLKLISTRKQFPLMMRHVTEYAKNNFILAGDAAHTIHPLAGLGVNLGLFDAALLTDVLTQQKSLRSYTRAAKANHVPIIAAMRLLQEIFSYQQKSINHIRSVGVTALNQFHFLKNILMRLGPVHGAIK